MVSEYKFSRMWDDQIGVTPPAALAATEKARMYSDHGFELYGSSQRKRTIE